MLNGQVFREHLFARDGTQNRAERKRSTEEDGGHAGSRYGDLEGRHEGKLVSPERRRRTPPRCVVVWDHRTFRSVKRAVYSIHLAVPSDTSRAGWMMNHVSFMRCARCLDKVHIS